ncbi:MAG: hypothetical protein IPK07_22520 [Deltaproteobacteria bacterium]|nr:hypothetical protein [Deltaproteobacteria bacterium]
MSARVLIRVTLVVLVLGGFVIGPQIWNRSQVVRNAAGYRRAELLVTGSACVGGHPEYDSDGHQTGTSAEDCALEGTIDGVEQELSIDKGSIPQHPQGSRLPVWFNPSMPANGINYDTLRVRWGDIDDVAAYERRALWTLAWLWGLPAILTVALSVLLGRARAFGVAGGAGDAFRVVTSSRQAPVGVPLMAFGLTLLWMQGASVAWAGVVLGGVLVAVGALLAAPASVAIDRAEKRWSRYRALGPLALLRAEEPWPSAARVGWAKTSAPSAADHGPWVVELRGGDGVERQLGTGTSVELARDRARELAGFLSVPIDEKPALASEEMFAPLIADATGAESAEPRLGVGETLPPAPEQRIAWRVVRAIPIVLLLAGSVALALSSHVAGRVGRAVVDPLTGMQALRRLGLMLLVRDASEPSILELTRLANCMDPERDAEIVGLALDGLGRLRGEDFDRSTGLSAAVGAANLWAAAKLGRELDGNGGVLTWYEPHRIMKPVLERIGSVDRNDAWVAWDHFGAGVLYTPSQFVCAAGSAFADARPIHFAVRRGSFFGYSQSPPPPFEGQPLAPGDYEDSALVTTVGAAVALQYWTREGVGGSELPEDLAAWWREWAPPRHLPPLPEGAPAP